MLKIELEDDQMHKIALLGMDGGMNKIKKSINMYDNSITLNKDNE